MAVPTLQNTSEHIKRLNAKPEPTGVELKDEVVMRIERFVKRHLVDLAGQSSIENSR